MAGRGPVWGYDTGSRGPGAGPGEAPWRRRPSERDSELRGRLGREEEPATLVWTEVTESERLSEGWVVKTQTVLVLKLLVLRPK